MTLASYSDLTTAVASWLAKSGDTTVTGNAADFVRLAEDRIRNDLQLQTQEVSNTSFSLSSEFTTFASISASMVKVRRLFLTASPQLPLQFYVPDQLVASYPSTTTGQPKAYSIVSLSIQVRPIPDTTYNAEIDYWKTFDPLATTSTNALLTANPSIYLFGSLVEAAAFLGNDKWMGIWEQRYQQAKKRIQDDSDNMNLPAGPLITRTDTGAP